MTIRISPRPFASLVHDGRLYMSFQLNHKGLQDRRYGFLTNMVGNDVKPLFGMEYRYRPKWIIVLMLPSCTYLRFVSQLNENLQQKHKDLVSFYLVLKLRQNRGLFYDNFPSQKILNVVKAVFDTNCLFLEAISSIRPHDRQFLVRAHRQSMKQTPFASQSLCKTLKTTERTLTPRFWHWKTFGQSCHLHVQCTLCSRVKATAHCYYQWRPAFGGKQFYSVKLWTLKWSMRTPTYCRGRLFPLLKHFIV